jgi:hypothetical protein
MLGLASPAGCPQLGWCPDGRVNGGFRPGLSPRGGLRTGQMPAILSIGDFSRAAHLSVKTLRHHHNVALLALGRR